MNILFILIYIPVMLVAMLSFVGLVCLGYAWWTLSISWDITLGQLLDLWAWGASAKQFVVGVDFIPLGWTSWTALLALPLGLILGLWIARILRVIAPRKP